MFKDIFDIHRNIMDDYQKYVTSFVNIQDDTIRYKVDAEIDKGLFWPDPLIQFRRPPGSTIAPPRRPPPGAAKQP